MDAVESMLDIEQLRLSVADQNIFNSIAQIHQWINNHGLALLKSNQKLPYTYEEAEEVRRFHEKVELKCMKFLAFYAHMNLQSIPEECESMRQDMDIVIHNFSERVKARRHVVVSFYTFYRHLEEYCRLLSDIKEEDHIHLPDTVADVNVVIEKYRNSISTVLRKFAHLKDEVDRVKASLDLVLKLDNDSETGFVSAASINKVMKHLHDLLHQTELVLQSCYESQSLLELEITIESRMMLIEDEIARSSGWLRQIEDKLVERYTNNAVGKATVENDLLEEENRELVKKLNVAHEFGCRMARVYVRLCGQFERETERGDEETARFTEHWNRVRALSAETTDRIKLAGGLFHNLDSTLEKVEDLLLAINKDRTIIDKNDSILQQYQSDINDIHVNFESIKKAEKELFNKLYLNLFNKKMVPLDPGYIEIEQTEDMVKMKIFTLWVKIKALDRCLSTGEIQIFSTVAPLNAQSPSGITDHDNADLIDIIRKYLNFLGTSRSKWKSKALPSNLEQAKRAIESHKKLAAQSNEYWSNIQEAHEGFKRSKKSPDEERVADLLAEAEKEKAKWDKNWSEHLQLRLNPRLEFLLKVQKFNNALEEDLNSLDDLVTRPNNNLALVKDLRKDLEKMANNQKSATLNELKLESSQFHKSGFDDLIGSLEDKLHAYINRLSRFLELVKLIESILEFLPELNVFRIDWHNRINAHRNNTLEMAQLKDEAKRIIEKVDRFDVDRLRMLATFVYGSSKRIEWLIDELNVDFTVPQQQRVITGSHRVIEKPIVPVLAEKSKVSKLDNVDNRGIDSPKKLLLVNAETDNATRLDFRFEALPKIEGDQYDVLWYKDNEPILPDTDSRFSIQRDSRSGQIHVNIDNCQESDAGKYWCEIRNGSSAIQQSSPVLLSVYSLKQGTVTPLFSDRTYGAANEPISFKLKLSGFKQTPACDLLFNNSNVKVNQRPCPWSMTSQNEVLDFNNSSLTPKDIGRYEFRVGGKIVAKTQLEIGQKPKFAFHELSDSCCYGEPLKIAVPMKNYANISQNNVLWKKNHVPLTPDMLDYKTYINNAGELVLDIPSFSPDHVGIYTCEVANEFGTEMLTLHLGIQEINEHVTAKVGDSVILDLNFTPGVKTEVAWTKDNKPIDKSDPRLQVYDTDSKSSLKIKNATPEDSGFYKAMVKDTGQNKITTVEIKALAFAPVIQDYPQSVRIKEDGTLNIVCVINSLPFAHSVTWTLKPADGGPLRNLMNSERYKIINKHFNDLSGHMQRIELFFDDVNLSDAGEYCLRVENPIGWSSVMIPVTVSAPIEVQNKRRPPRFLQQLESEMFVQINETVSFKCKVTGNPTPIVKWLRNGKELQHSNRLKFMKTLESHELRLEHLQSSDSGLYEAVASNNQGVQVSKCQLKVIDFINNSNISDKIVPEENILPSSAVSNRRQPNECNETRPPRRTQMIFNNSVVRSPPQFITTFTDEIVNEGDDVVLKCCLIGYPEPVVWWSYNTHFINNPRFQLTRELDEYYLVARNIQKSDSGRYSITAENSSGLATCSALIVVDDKQPRRAYVSVLDLSRFCSNSSALKSVDRTKYPTNSRSLPRDAHNSNLRLPPKDESTIIQASPQRWAEYQRPSNGSTPHQFQKLIPSPEPDHDGSKTTTKTVKTYHYSGPSGVDLPGIGYIPRINSTINNSFSSSSSSKSHVGVAKFVPSDDHTGGPYFLSTYGRYEDPARYSVVESSDCDYPL